MRGERTSIISIVNPTFGAGVTGGYDGLTMKQFEKAVTQDSLITNEELLKNKYEQSNYLPTDDEKEIRTRIIKDYTLGTQNMWIPRVELNDLAVIQRMQVDQMAFNTYQANNGFSMAADDIQGWRSNAVRPVVRNKCISIAAHATAKLIFPKIFAYNQNSDEDRDAAQVMEDLMEWAADQSNYRAVALRRVIAALTDPASIGYTEYAETYRRVKLQKKENGEWDYRIMLDEILSGFQDICVPVDELFIENFYENDLQKQGFLIWRRVISYSLAKAKYGSLYPKFNEYVRPGVQALYSDANSYFYYVYDPYMRQYDVEEIIYWNKALDVKIIMVNGVVLTDCDNPNPRLDKLYPFDKFGYELINNRCFYYKSLAFKLQSDANIVNTLYPMIIDGTYLEVMKPMLNVGQEMIASDVVVPGAVTTLSDPNAKLSPIFGQPINLRSGMDTLNTVEESISETSADNLQSGQPQGGSQTAYEISRQEQNAATVLGLFIQMIGQHVKEFGKLRLGDILQYLTIAETDKIEANKDLTYKTFLLHDKQSGGGTKTRKIKFDASMSSVPMSKEERLRASFDTLKEQGGINADTELYKVNPELFRNSKFMCMVSPDVLNPRSADLERAYSLESFDRMVMHPEIFDPEETGRLLLQADPKMARGPDKYIAKQGQSAPNMPTSPQDMAMQSMQKGVGKPQSGNSPLDAVSGKTPLPQSMPGGTL